MNRKQFVGVMVGAAAALTAKVTKADGVLQVSNNTQIVSTGDVFLRQAANGMQDVYDDQGNYVGQVSNSAQVVTTGSVYMDQEAVGRQSIQSAKGQCTAGDYVTFDNSVRFCNLDCQWVLFQCSAEKRCCK